MSAADPEAGGDGAALPAGAVLEAGDPSALDRRTVRRALAQHGFVVVRGLGPSILGASAFAPAGPGPAAPAQPDGFRIVERALGERPEMAEVQVLRPVPGARSFAGSSVHTPLHTDSQPLLGVAATVQVLVAVRPARVGGETTLLDGHAVLGDVERADPALFDALFDTPRAVPFYFGAVVGPTVALRRGHLTLTHAPIADPADPVGRAFSAFVQGRPPSVVRLAAGDVLLLDNHRMLHGRLAFDDPGRLLVRALGWLPVPLADHPHLRARAARAAAPHDREPRPLPAPIRAVIDVIAGVAPATIARREGIPEATLYAWRSVALDAALHALVPRAPRDG